MNLKNITKTIFITLFFMSLTSSAKAQMRTHEVGVKVNSLNSFSLLYKLQRAENKFLRLSASFNLGSVFAAPEESFFTNAGLNVGFERRVAISEKFQFLHGFMPGVGLNYSITKVGLIQNHNLGGSLNLGYILGFQYNFAKSFYVGLETIPTLSVSTSNILNPNFVSVGGGFNPNVGVTFVYQFEKEKKNKK